MPPHVQMVLSSLLAERTSWSGSFVCPISSVLRPDGTSEDANGNGYPDECECPDINGDGAVNVTDLLAIITAWGPCDGCPEDINLDGSVGVIDLLEVIGAWGGDQPCP